MLLLVMLGLACLWAQSGFDLEAFSDSTKYGWNDYQDRSQYRQDLISRQNMLQLYELEALSVQENLLKSAVVPAGASLPPSAAPRLRLSWVWNWFL
jgi:hypothetical protein